jgi:hypothetical protein
MFEQTFQNIDDILHKDAGCTREPVGKDNGSLARHCLAN